MITFEELIRLFNVTVRNCDESCDGWCSQCPFNSPDSMIRCTELMVVACSQRELFEVRDGFVRLIDQGKRAGDEALRFQEKRLPIGDGGRAELHTVEEVAQALHLAVNTIRIKARKGEIAAVKVGRRWLIPDDEFQRVLIEGA